MKFQEFSKAIKGGDISPFYLISGDDAYFISRVLDLLKGLASEDFALMNLEVFDNKPDVYTLVSALTTEPVFAERRVVIVKDWADTLNANETAVLTEYLKNPSDTAVLAVVDTAAKLAPLASYATSVVCSKASRDQVVKWIRIRAAKDDVLIDETAANRLAEMTRDDMARVSKEVEKLTAYAGGNGAKIVVKDIESTVVPELEVQAYELSNALADGTTDRVWTALESMLSAGFKEMQILGGITSQFRRMYYAVASTESPESLAKQLGCKEYAIKKAKASGMRFGAETLRRCVMMLDEQEYLFKSGKANRESFVTDTVIKLLAARS